MEKKRYSVRDTIPETPNSFYDTVEKTAVGRESASFGAEIGICEINYLREGERVCQRKI